MIEEKTNKKGNTFVKIILILILFAVMFVLGYFIGQTIGKAENKKEETKEETKKEEKLNKITLTKESEVVKNLFEAFREDQNYLEYNMVKNDTTTETIKSDFKLYYTFRNIPESDFTKAKCGDMDIKQEHIYMCFDDYDKMDENLEKLTTDSQLNDFVKDMKVDVVSTEKFDKKYKELFGQDSVYTNSSFVESDSTIIHFDQKNNNYARYSCVRCGGDGAGLVEQKITDVVHNGDDLSIVTKGTIGIDESTKEVTITYNFKYEEATNRFIWSSREEK